MATAWYSLLEDLARYTFYFNPQSARIFAYSGLTLYESIVPGMPSYLSVFEELSGQTIDFNGNTNDYYWPASANAALAEIAGKIVQDYPQTPNLAAIDQLEAALRSINGARPMELLFFVLPIIRLVVQEIGFPLRQHFSQRQVPVRVI